VESPAKAKTIEKYLGKGYEVKACGGHIRDLPPSKLGVDVESDFEPTYQVIKGKQKIIDGLKKSAEGAETVYLAPDPDREGEAIAWHLKYLLGKAKVKRIEFHEITKSAVEDALKHPRAIDEDRVNAQQARRILDRLVGYKISPLLWRKIRKGLSAGRVQSVAVRLIVEREKLIDDFKPVEYWSIEAELSKLAGAIKNEKDKQIFIAKLIGKGDDKLVVNNATEADKILSVVKTAQYVIKNVTIKEGKRHPAPPFITSTLQQEASRKLGYTAKKTMMMAQGLYEAGFITYMRTDSVRIAQVALDAVRKLIEEKYGVNHLPEKPNAFKTKKSAQDAHEAIRPSLMENDPEAIKDRLQADQYKLYQLIWNRFVACQMLPAIFDNTTVNIDAGGYLFRANGSVRKFDGFMAVYVEGKDFASEEDEEGAIPVLSEGEKLQLVKLDPKQHFTEPPARFNEATLVKEMEARGIGRPSTYAPTIATIQDRGYITKDGRALKPTELGVVTNEQLVKTFPQILDYEFTAKMEDQLDDVVEGKEDWVKLLKDFYKIFKKSLDVADKVMDKVKTEKMTEEKCPTCGKNLVQRQGRFGEFLACSGFPKCRYTRNLGEDEKPTGEVCEKCGKPMVIKHSRFGKMLACSGYPDCKNFKPMLSTTGVKCPRQGCTGDLVIRRTKRGKVFYSCSTWPECRFALWDKPVNEKCPNCGSILVEKVSKKETVHKCTNVNCDYKKVVGEEGTPA
jgi:DNA topoisomerase-1